MKTKAVIWVREMPFRFAKKISTLKKRFELSHFDEVRLGCSVTIAAPKSSVNVAAGVFSSDAQKTSKPFYTSFLCKQTVRQQR